MVVPSVLNNGGDSGDRLIEVDGAAGSEADSFGGAALEAVADNEAGALCDLFPDDKKNGSAVEAVADDEVSAAFSNRWWIIPIGQV